MPTFISRCPVGSLLRLACTNPIIDALLTGSDLFSL